MNNTINKMLMNKIEEQEKQAEELRQALNLGCPVKDIIISVKDIGGKVTLCAKPRGNKVRRLNDGSFEILTRFYKGNHRETVYEIVRALGYLISNCEYFDKEKWNNIPVNKWQTEKQADVYLNNNFAAIFMMPRKEFIKKTAEYTICGKLDTNAVAEYFGVSEGAVSLRAAMIE